MEEKQKPLCLRWGLSGTDTKNTDLNVTVLYILPHGTLLCLTCPHSVIWDIYEAVHKQSSDLIIRSFNAQPPTNEERGINLHALLVGFIPSNTRCQRKQDALGVALWLMTATLRK